MPTKNHPNLWIYEETAQNPQFSRLTLKELQPLLFDPSSDEESMIDFPHSNPHPRKTETCINEHVFSCKVHTYLVNRFSFLKPLLGHQNCLSPYMVTDHILVQ
jgi:hypothetical protein